MSSVVSLPRPPQPAPRERQSSRGSPLAEFETHLHGCRFCPMCKPASEVANVSSIEGHSTRARGMFLWRKLHGFTGYTPRYVELLYQSTLDSISEAWCVSHYPVTAYHLAARREVCAAGLLPAPVQAALVRPQLESREGASDTLVLCGEIAELNDPAALEVMRALIARSGRSARLWATPTGHLAHVLGDAERARQTASQLAQAITSSGVRTVVADGAATFYALKKLLPAAGSLPAGIRVLSLGEWLGTFPVEKKQSGRVLVHDARAAYLVADTPATSEVIKPEFSGPEEQLGTGALYEHPRALVRAAGLEPVFSAWQRNLAKSSGADDGLWLTYPGIARALARQRLEHARIFRSDTVVSESPLAAAWLRQEAAASAPGTRVLWLPELVLG